MKKILTLVLALFLFGQTVNAISFSSEAKKASEILIPIGTTGKTISMQELAAISVKDFETLTGKKMGFADRAMFKSAQRKIRRSINDDGTLNNRQIEKFSQKYVEEKTGFNIGGFALGLFLGLIGVLIAYIINNDNNRNRHTWAWIGWGVLVIIVLIASI
jgi:hypothetical protein